MFLNRYREIGKHTKWTLKTNMDTATLLIGFAEIAISMAGFTAIATIIAWISDTTTQNLLAVRLKMVLIFGVHLIIISLAPFVLCQFDPDPERYWRSSALVSFVSIAPVAYIGFFSTTSKNFKRPQKLLVANHRNHDMQHIKFRDRSTYNLWYQCFFLVLRDLVTSARN
jgi:hypothetical protein